MAELKLSYNAKNAYAKSLVDVIKLSGVFNVVPIKSTKSPYNPEFVAKIKQSEKQEGTKINLKDLWK
ncbi:MAG: hypothetical protein LBN95_09465 [Prevotellaceae bacterium]|jgi:hypothetical protein|nr:hypothetical protein [Prevotellaceae bacterium]